jgi:hypothetical protein
VEGGEERLIVGNSTWNQRVAAMTTRSRPLYTFEIPDEGIIIASFVPSEANVTLDFENLFLQPLWARAAALDTARLTAVLDPTQGYVQAGDDGDAIAQPPNASVTRFNFGSSIKSCAAYLGWQGIELPPGSPDLSRAVSLTLAVVSTMGTGTYTPYGEIDWSVLGSTPYVGAALPSGWHQALYSNIAGWTDLVTSVQLWPGNVDVGDTFPDLNRIEVRVSEVGATTGSSTDGITFSATAQLVIAFA